MHQYADFEDTELSVAFPASVDRILIHHFDRGPIQEDLTFAYWLPSNGSARFTAIIDAVALPAEGDRILQGNVAFTHQYLARVLDNVPNRHGIALIHSHLGPGWQDMSHDDVVAEQTRLASVVAGRTALPLLGLTWGTDGTWSARFWLRRARHAYERVWAQTVRVVGKALRTSHYPSHRTANTAKQAATLSVWGEQTQMALQRAHIGIVGLGSVGSIAAEALSRTGAQRLTLIDFDSIEPRNLDRTIGAFEADARGHRLKVDVAKANIERTHTAESISIEAVGASVTEKPGLQAALNCDIIISCVDRPWPRHVLSVISYAHLIPVVDGGILARVSAGKLLHVDWRIHTIGPSHPCLYCIDALRRSDVGLDRDGQLDNPDYVQGLSQADKERYAGRNVFAFSLSVAAHQVLHAITLLGGNERIGGIGAQTYHAYPGTMELSPITTCVANCDIQAQTASAALPF